MKTGLITGITGQDGSYLAELLLEKGYRVCGLVLPEEMKNLGWLEPRRRELDLFIGDLTDENSLIKAVTESQPNEIYSLAAQSNVALSWEKSVLTADITGMGAIRLMEAVRNHAPEARFFQASSSELFGAPTESPQTEKTRIFPRNPYGWAKAFAHGTARSLREHFGLFICTGILYNHESIRRPEGFVTQKIAKAAVEIKAGKQEKLVLGNISAVRDWGYAPDYVQAMWMMLQQPEPDDYILATGKPHTVEDFCRAAFNAVGLNYRKYLEIDQAFYRSEDGHPLVGDASKAKECLGWKAEKKFEEIVIEMVEMVRK